jgi:hypothetical protein
VQLYRLIEVWHICQACRHSFSVTHQKGGCDDSCFSKVRQIDNSSPSFSSYSNSTHSCVYSADYYYFAIYLYRCDLSLPYSDLPILEERISGGILKIVNILGNVKNVTVTILATSITNTLFMIIGTKTVSIYCISSKVNCSVISGGRIKYITLSLSNRPVMAII